MSNTTTSGRSTNEQATDNAQSKTLAYRFTPHYHPFALRLLQDLEEGKVDLALRSEDYETELTIDAQAEAIASGTTFPKHPTLDLGFGTPYGDYNREVFFHGPLLIAMHLTQNQRFEEAQRWFHRIFNPQAPQHDGVPSPARFWQFGPFRDGGEGVTRDLLLNLTTGDDPEAQDQTAQALAAWRARPFSPHAVARFRQTAYMQKTVFAYLDNLIAWGDALFRQNTRETINEASQIYVQAEKLLGPRPQHIPAHRASRPMSYGAIRTDTRRALQILEEDVPFDRLTNPPDVKPDDPGRLRTLRNISSSLDFCIPSNDKLTGYWDTVADRLFKIRNSLNIDGTFRRLALFSPPIDPRLLAAAASAGIDISTLLDGSQQPLPLVRFQPMLQRAVELAQSVKSLGSALLSALEKQDSEALQVLRAVNEKAALDRATIIRNAQVHESTKQTEALQASLEGAAARLKHYKALLANTSNESTTVSPLDTAALGTTGFASFEPSLSNEDEKIETIVKEIGTGDDRDGRFKVHLNQREATEFDALADAQHKYVEASKQDLVAAIWQLVPGISFSYSPGGVGFSTGPFGGNTVAEVYRMHASGSRSEAGAITYRATQLSKEASYQRREEEWTFQSNVIRNEINGVVKQLRAAQIRKAIAEAELKNHLQQVKESQEIVDFLESKKTDVDLYAWLARETRGLHARCFSLAFEMAQKAQQAARLELGNPGLQFLDGVYMDGEEGLMAGDRLYFDLKRMEMAYLQQNKREYELTKHLSLLQLNPIALLELRATGKCSVRLPEELFDTDGPGHYFRRIKTVSLSMPCVAGPYTSINCKLTQTSSSVRTSASTGDGYSRTGGNDGRFSDADGQVQSIVTSSGVNDSGLFELALRDERFLPFEGTGAISEWELELPAGPRQFDYNTISDVIMHVRYTAREGGEELKQAATERLRSLVSTAQAAGLTRLFSLRHEFPTEWAHYLASPESPAFAKLEITLTPEHFPFWLKDATKVKQASLCVRTTESSVSCSRSADGSSPTELIPNPSLEGPEGEPQLTTSTPVGLATVDGGRKLTVYLNKRDLDDVLVAVTLRS